MWCVAETTAHTSVMAPIFSSSLAVVLTVHLRIVADSSVSIAFLGILTALTQPSPDALRTAIKETRTLTRYPFGVNITLLPSISPPDYEGYARAAVEEGVRIFETAGNNREQYTRGVWWTFC